MLKIRKITQKFTEVYQLFAGLFFILKTRSTKFKSSDLDGSFSSF